jgi:subtilisin family serine protease
MIAETTDAAAPTQGSRVVVALFDSGINPYHEVFRGSRVSHLDFDIVDGVTGAPPELVNLTLGGDFQADLDADAAFWRTVQPGRLYGFLGTNVLAISFQDPSEQALILDETFTSHGSSTAYNVIRENPDALILMIQAASAIPTTGANGQETAGLRWAAAQVWIDAISISLGPPVQAMPGYDETPAALRSVVEAGKLVVASVGNQPIPYFSDPIAGPPWVVGVGGVISDSRGEAVIAAKIPDLVSDFRGLGVSKNDTRAFVSFGGTSLAAPTVAAQMAKAILLTRQHYGHTGGIRDGALVQWSGGKLTNADFRAAFNRTAVYWNTTDYRGQNLSESPIDAVIYASAPVLPTPWMQMGWGYVGPGVAEAAVADLVAGPSSSKPVDAETFMAGVDAARWAFWGSQNNN